MLKIQSQRTLHVQRIQTDDVHDTVLVHIITELYYFAAGVCVPLPVNLLSFCSEASFIYVIQLVYPIRRFSTYFIILHLDPTQHAQNQKWDVLIHW